ncbi:MAG: hypothetical protein N2318_00155, partial [Meiothermus sp.]|nr:hypothetical protein [Meiothermus sp.]
MNGRTAQLKALGSVVLLGLALLLGACGGVQPAQAPLSSSDSYLLTVPLTSSDTQAGVAERYGGEVLAWLEGQAILKLSSQALAALPARGVSLQNTTVDPNLRMEVPMQAAGTSAGGWNSWAGGWN